jgi:hypothetical protein
MNRHWRSDGSQPRERFRSRFQHKLLEYRSRHGSAAEGFGRVWEETLAEVALDSDAQGTLYQELITWAKGDKSLAHSHQHELLRIWRDAVHDF